MYEKRANIFHRETIVFKQWTRKSYAVFASLKKEVRIAILSVSITNVLASKGKRIIIDIVALLNQLTLSAEESQKLKENQVELLLIEVQNKNNDIAAHAYFMSEKFNNSLH